MADVTVIGAGGTTVTIQMTSALNAAVAQTAMWNVSNLAAAPGLPPPNPNPNGVGILQQQDFTGAPPPPPGNLLGGVVVQTAGDVGALTANYVSAVVAATGNSTIVGPSNFKSVLATTDGSNTTYINLSQQGEVYFGKGDNFLVNQGGATAFFDEGASVLQTTAGSNTNALLADNALVLVQGDGNSTLSAEPGSDIVVAVQGASTVPVTVQGTNLGGSIQYLAIGGAGIINPAGLNTTVFGNVGNGKVTVFGGNGPGGATAPAFTGKLTVVEGQGYFAAGSAGGSQLFSSTVAGSATLQGGGDGDLLFSMGAGQFLIAGAGSETLTGFNVAASVGGSIFQSGSGNATMFGNSGGGNTFALGAGLTLVDGRNEAVLGGAVGNANTFYAVAAGGGTGVSDFISGLDTFNLTLTTTVTGETLSSLTFYTAGESGSPFGAGSGTRMILSGGTTVDFFGTEVKNTDLT